MRSWLRSSHCGGGECVEVGWHRAPCDAGTCVEVNTVGVQDTVLVRSSTDPHTVVSFTRDEWRVFIDGVKGGEFDV